MIFFKRNVRHKQSAKVRKIFEITRMLFFVVFFYAVSIFFVTLQN